MQLILLTIAFASQAWGAKPNKNAEPDEPPAQVESPVANEDCSSSSCSDQDGSFTVDDDADDAPQGPEQNKGPDKCNPNVVINGNFRAVTHLHQAPSVVSIRALSPEVSVSHKIDIDPAEDRCIQRVEVSRANDRGCEFLLVFEGPVPSSTSNYEGALSLVEGLLHADSFCPGWPDDIEGVYEFFSPTDQKGAITLQMKTMHVPDAMADYSCIQNQMSVVGSRRLTKTSDMHLWMQNLTLDATLLSQGDTPGHCLEQNPERVAKASPDLNHYLDLLYRARTGKFMSCSDEGANCLSTSRLSYYLGGRYSVGSWIRYTAMIDYRIPTETASLGGVSYAPSALTLVPVGVAVAASTDALDVDLYAGIGRAWTALSPVSKSSTVRVLGSTQRFFVGSKLYLATDLGLRSTKEFATNPSSFDQSESYEQVPESTASMFSASAGLGFHW